MKLKISNLNKLFKLATADEIDFIIYISQFQNELGQVRGIRFNDVCQNISISKSNFYKVLYSLDEKNIIRVHFKNSEYALWDIDIMDNVFITKEDMQQGYINLNHYILHTEEFIKLTKSEKVVILHMLTRFRENQRAFNSTYEKLMEVTGCLKQSVMRFVKNISALTKFFNIEETKNGIKVYMDTLAFSRRVESERDIYNKHTLKRLLNKKKVLYTQKEIKDTLTLFKQYGKRMTFNRILDLVAYCIKEKASLIPRYINSIIGKSLEGKFIYI